MKRIDLYFLIALAALSSSFWATAARSDETTDRLKACAKIAEEATRVACYETLGQETLADDAGTANVTAGSKAESTAAVAASDKSESTAVVAASGTAESATDAAAASAAATTATVAATSAPTNVPIKGERPAEEYRVAVSSCRKNNVGETFFTLDNGEIWKYTGGKQLRESDCVFSATLRKDFFGYKLSVDDDGGSLRVKRVK